MENSSSSHDYGYSTSQEIPHLLGNLKCDYHYKRLHIKTWKQYSLNQYKNKVVCVLCWRSQCTEEPSTESDHEPNKNNQILPSYFFQTLTFTLSSGVTQVYPPVQVFKANFVFPSSLP